MSRAFLFIFNFICMGVLPARMSVSVQRPEEGTQSSGTRVTDGCELPGGCWELNLSPLEEQPVLLTVESFTEPSDHHDLSHLPLPAWPP